MNPMIDEAVLRVSRDLELSTHRVRMRQRTNGADDVISIMLDQVASCGVVRRSKPALLGCAAVCVLLALVLSQSLGAPSIVLVLGLLAAVLVVSYFFSRLQYLVITSAGETIRVRTSGVGIEDLLGFVDELEAAKNLRYLRGGP